MQRRDGTSRPTWRLWAQTRSRPRRLARKPCGDRSRVLRELPSTRRESTLRLAALALGFAASSPAKHTEQRREHDDDRGGNGNATFYKLTTRGRGRAVTCYHGCVS